MERKIAKSIFTHIIQNLAMRHLKKIEAGIDTWYCEADCGLCSRAALNGHKTVTHVKCVYKMKCEYETLEKKQQQKTNCTRTCPKCEVLNFSYSYFDTQCNFEQSNRFHPLVKDINKAFSASRINKSTSFKGLKFVSININGIKGKKLELVAFLIVIKLTL